MSLRDRLVGWRRRIALPKTSPTKNPECTEFEIDGWQLSEFVLERLVPMVEIRPFPLTELMLLSGAVCRFRPSHIFEWGTHVGKSARAFFEITRHYDIPSEIHSVDLPDEAEHVEHPSRERGRMVRGLNRVHLHQGDGVDVALKVWRTAGRPERVLFFVDGDHSEDSVYREPSHILTEVPRPVVLLHDSFYQSPQSGYNVGPHLAITRAMEDYRGRFRRMDSALGLPGMSLIYAT
jgi:hypothetical protein